MHPSYQLRKILATWHPILTPAEKAARANKKPAKRGRPQRQHEGRWKDRLELSSSMPRVAVKPLRISSRLSSKPILGLRMKNGSNRYARMKKLSIAQAVRLLLDSYGDMPCSLLDRHVDEVFDDSDPERIMEMIRHILVNSSMKLAALSRARGKGKLMNDIHVKVKLRGVAIVLAAIADLEEWDSQAHLSVERWPGKYSDGLPVLGEGPSAENSARLGEQAQRS